MNNVMTPEIIEQTHIFFNPEDSSAPGSTTITDQGRLDVEAYLRHYDIGYRIKNNGSGIIYNLDQCPFDSSHGKDSSIIQGREGKLRFHCFHDGCTGLTWKDAREQISGFESLTPFFPLSDMLKNREKVKPKTPMILKVVTAGEILSMEFKPRETLLSPWLNTQGLAMIHASRGVGKTLIGIGIAVAVSSGGNFLYWNSPKPSGVLYLDGEMPGGVLQERIAQAINGSTKEPIEPLKIITPDLQENGMPDLSKEDWQEALEPCLQGISLIIVDNISTLCRTGRENEGESWLPLQEWALRLRSRGYSIVFIHHDGKGGQQRGTSRKEDVLDTVIHLKHPGDYRPEQGARFEVHFEKARMIYGDDVKGFEAQLTVTADGGWDWSMKSIEESLTQRVADLLNDGVPQYEINELLGVAKGTVSKHKKKAQQIGLLK
jgi:hypothetical protein